MKAISLVVAVVSISASPIVFVSCTRESAPTIGGQQPSSADEMIRITPERIPIAQARMELCIRPPDIGPHDVPEILVYANPIALEYRRKHASEYNYPIGSKFVKEKFSRSAQTDPDAATVMVRKSDRGDIADWEFATISLPDKRPLAPANERSCIGCHEGFAERGFISSESEEALRRHLHLE